MATLTLLEVVNFYMDYSDGFRVANIDDTIESLQVSSIAEKVFYDLVNDVFSSDLTQEIIQLEALADSTRPNYLKLPDSSLRIKDSQVMYNVATGATGASTLNLKQIPYKRPQDFLTEVGNRSTNQANTQIVTDSSGYKMVIQNKTAPQFFTSFDDSLLVFDSFDSDVDSTLQSSKSGVVVSKQRSWTPSGTYVIDFPEHFHMTYLNAVIAEASEVLREEPSHTAARKAKMGIMKARKKQRIGSDGLDSRKRKYGR